MVWLFVDFPSITIHEYEIKTLSSMIIANFFLSLYLPLFHFIPNVSITVKISLNLGFSLFFSYSLVIYFKKPIWMDLKMELFTRNGGGGPAIYYLDGNPP